MGRLWEWTPVGTVQGLALYAKVCLGSSRLFKRGHEVSWPFFEERIEDVDEEEVEDTQMLLFGLIKLKKM